ncbi:6-phosphofructokinase [Acetanaerobacterium elongatum]|uniref:ATP-dependent 6-phosphofructokinase n=1 Tax=Acetanaerobacterium elongatum TaxID=258515 RepID=A0A1H0ATJ5_9FIRM|nr:6-phosphofructokinase [Acetanaerobacterium elongatum]SDN36711.1 6-phosphofructokinase [Acetanaerobacterium elongatum]
MSDSVKTIGVLTSGGDAPGMNATVRSVVRTGLHMGMRVLGIRHGYNGLISGDMVEMNLRSVSDIIHRGGTILYTARCPEFREQAGLEKAKKTCQAAGLDGIVVIGGDGSFRGARDLSLLGIPCVGLPGTIDNDIASSDYTIGFDTAMNTAMQMVDRLRDTTQSHDRCSVVEVMGRHAGYIALNTGIACGATSILVPEVPFDFKRDIYDRMMNTRKTGKQHFIIVVAEGVVAENNPSIDELAKRIQTETGIETRATVLGHVQRGGSPTVEDRVNASLMGNYAVELLNRGIGNRVVVMRDNKIVDIDIYEALQMKKTIDMHTYEVAHQISI